MKSILIIVALIAICGSTNAQIKSFSAAKPIVKEKEHKVTYDSTTNFVGKNTKDLLGQELYVIPKSERTQKNGYRGFYLDYNKTYNTMAEIDAYELYAGKTFIVEEILPKPQNPSIYAKETNDNPVLKLKEKDGDKIYYYVYEYKYRRNFPFVIMGFWEKEKTRCVGKQLVIKKDKNPWETYFKEKEVPMYDARSGMEVKIDPNAPWTIQELIIDQDHGVLAYLITNEKGETLTIELNDVNDYKRFTGPCVLRYDDTLKEIHKKKPEMYEKIMTDKISVGMTEDMARFSWGEPKKIDHGSYADTWFYETGQILFFKNGILSSFQ